MSCISNAQRQRTRNMRTKSALLPLKLNRANCSSSSTLAPVFAHSMAAAKPTWHPKGLAHDVMADCMQRSTDLGWGLGKHTHRAAADNDNIVCAAIQVRLRGLDTWHCVYAEVLSR